MGRSKVDLPFGSTTFLGRVVDAARPVFDRVIGVQRASGTAVGVIETIFEESHDSEAPVFGVLRALQHAASDCFILAVDYPLVTGEVLRYIEERFRRSAAPLVAPRWNEKMQMLCAAYAKSMTPALEERIRAGRFDLRGLADQAEIIDEHEMRSRFAGEPLMNVNTPEELQIAMRLI